MAKDNKPLPFHLLYKDSLFTIFSEPSRSIPRSTDKGVYRKVCEAFSVAADPATQQDVEPEKAIILRPNDLVTPLPRPRTFNRPRN